jgi:leader peptidase (prepilin peptidase) / N-methyltransferase
VVALLVGALVVGPGLAHAVLRWMGWRVALPLVTGSVAPFRSLGRPRVRCRRCGEGLAPFDLPAHSWLWRRGRCRRCGEAIAVWVLGIEVVTGLVFALVAWRVGWSVALVPVLALAAGLVAMSAVDLWCARIPTMFVYVTGTVVGAGLVLATVTSGEDDTGALRGALIGAATYLVVLGALWLASPRFLGFGDVRLGVVVGLVVGWAGWSQAHPVDGPLSLTVGAMMGGSLAGSAVGVVLMARRRGNQPFPFGPWLSLGGLVAILASL